MKAHEFGMAAIVDKILGGFFRSANFGEQLVCDVAFAEVSTQTALAFINV
jgi:hypothetical protein